MKSRAIKSSVKNFRVLVTNFTGRYIAALFTVALLVGSSPFLTIEMIEQQEENRKVMGAAAQLADLGKTLSQSSFSKSVCKNDLERTQFFSKTNGLLLRLEDHFSLFRQGIKKIEFIILGSEDLSNRLIELRTRYQALVKAELSLRTVSNCDDPSAHRLFDTTVESARLFSMATSAFVGDLEKAAENRLEIFKKIAWSFTFLLFLVLILQGTFILIPAIQKVSKTLYDLKISEEKLLEAKEEALEALQIRSEFITKISHEIRNPLNAILGIGDLLLETPLDLGQRRYVEIFRRAGQSILDLINDFLDFSRLEAGKVDLEKIKFDIIETAERAIDIVANRAEDKGLELNLDFDPELPAVLLGDPKRIQQILVNLLGNAIKFTSSGEVLLSVRKHHPPGGASEILLSVSDTGIGIPKDLQSRIFESFVQVDSSISRKFGGTGLGLAICRDLAKIMGGRITLESTEGRGSIFNVFLPIDLGSESRGLSRWGEFDFNGLRILILDQNHRRIEILRTHLQNLSAKVEVISKLDSEVDFSLFQVLLLDQEWISKIAVNNPSMSPQVKLICFSKLRDLRQVSNKWGSRSDCFCIPKPIKMTQIIGILNDFKKIETNKTLSQSSFEPSFSLLPFRTLIVEDSDDNQLVMQAYLKNVPAQISFALNGKEGLQKFKDGEFDLVFMDMQMPEMDGFAATSAIRDFEKTHNRKPTPIVALSAYGHRDEIRRCLEAGCNRHVTKPIRKSTLLEVIVEVLRKSGKYKN